jgi:5-methylcytosine-specific restriction endonuclease McrA
MKTAEKIQAIDLRKQGWSIDRIANRLGVSKASAYTWTKHLPQPEAFTKEGRTRRKAERLNREKEEREKWQAENPPKISIGSKDDYNEYMREYMKQRYSLRRQAAIEKLGGVCVVCGSDHDLEIDHRDRKKKSFDLAKALAGWSQKRVDAELKKCQLLCKTCHQKKTISDLGQTARKGIHGTVGNYNHGCRCDPCRAAKSEYRKQRLKQSDFGT